MHEPDIEEMEQGLPRADRNRAQNQPMPNQERQGPRMGKPKRNGPPEFKDPQTHQEHYDGEAHTGQFGQQGQYYAPTQSQHEQCQPTTRGQPEPFVSSYPQPQQAPPAHSFATQYYPPSAPPPAEMGSDPQRQMMEQLRPWLKPGAAIAAVGIVGVGGFMVWRKFNVQT